MKLAAALFTFLATSAWAQSPEVPSKMQFAGITLSIRDDARREIQKDVDMLTQSPKYFNIKVERAKTYFPIIEKVFEQERIPAEFKFLALQESALIGDAVSTSNAVGFWQFKDFTAIEMGLRVDKEIDERMNIEASSRAAAKYLKKNNYYFNNWVYALQAYQMGAGGVLQSVKDHESGAKHMEVTSKTYWYVKKFLAHMVAYGDAVSGQGQIKVLPLVNQSRKSMAELAKEFAVSEEELKSYNKWVRTNYIPDDRAYTVFIPTAGDSKTLNDAVIRASKPIESTGRVDARPAVAKNESVRINGIMATKALPNETIANFSKRADVDLSYFLKCNDLSITDKLIAGNFYYLKKKKARASVPQHVAVKGDDLWSISQKYGVQLRKLRKYNNISNGNKIVEGSVISLAGKNRTGQIIELADVPEVNPGDEFNWSAQPEPIQTSKRPVIVVTTENAVQTVIDSPTVSEPIVVETSGAHTVGPGETLYSIAKRYKVGVMNLVEWNNLNLQEGIKPGQVLKVADSQPASVELSVTEKSEEIIHLVKSSDTLYSVARQYGVSIKELMDWNQKKDFSLAVGENLKIKKK